MWRDKKFLAVYKSSRRQNAFLCILGIQLLFMMIRVPDMFSDDYEVPWSKEDQSSHVAFIAVNPPQRHSLI